MSCNYLFMFSSILSSQKIRIYQNIIDMPPKRIIKSAAPKSKPPSIITSFNERDCGESADAELKFDQEVLWSISQFEKLISTGNLPEAKSKSIFFLISVNSITVGFSRTRKHQSDQHAEKAQYPEDSEDPAYETVFQRHQVQNAERRRTC